MKASERRRRYRPERHFSTASRLRIRQLARREIRCLSLNFRFEMKQAQLTPETLRASPQNARGHAALMF